MARRSRLPPVEIDPATGMPRGLETKAMVPSYPDGVWRPPARAPIAGVAGEASATAALAELAETLTAARREGRLVQALPLAAVDESYLVRDRLALDPEDLAALEASLRARGQQVPVEVADLGQGRYGLISGWRRLTALRRLAAEGQGPGTVLAVVRAPGEAAAAYRAMVEENEIRSGLSFWERARIVVQAVEKGVYRADRVALADLFGSAPAARRSKIGSFVRVVRALDGTLRFPAALTEKLGLALAAALDRQPDLAGQVAAALAARPPADAAAEARLLTRLLAPPKPVAAAPAAPAAGPAELGWHYRPGRLTLTGAGLDDPALRADLAAWLAGRLAQVT